MRFFAETRGGEGVLIRPAIYALLAAWIGFLSFPEVSAEVGILLGGIRDEIVMESVDYNWTMRGGACFVGQSRNLIVDPVLDQDFMKTQKLLTNITGPRLCQWLDQTYAQHIAQKARWEETHAKAKNKVSMFNVLKKLKDAFTSFPTFTIQVTVKYFDLWHDDRWGNPMPWMMATFEYKYPKNGYGLFSHIPSVFSMNPALGQVAVVHVLLNPPPTFNQYVNLGKENGSIISAIAGGTGMGHTILAMDKDTTVAKVFHAGQMIYALANNILTTEFAIGDFWLRGTSCYILTRLAVISAINGMDLCQFLADRGSGGLWALYKAEKQKSVAVTFTGVDFFNYHRPTFEAIITEGVFIGGVNDTPVVLELVTDPLVIPEYIGTTKGARKVRWAVSLFRFFQFAADIAVKFQEAQKKKHGETVRR